MPLPPELTLAEIAREIGSYRQRLQKLVRRAKLRPTGVRRVNPAGPRAKVYRVAEVLALLPATAPEPPAPAPAGVVAGIEFEAIHLTHLERQRAERARRRECRC